MIPYLDASALVKRYVAEASSDDVISLTAKAPAVATALISRAEVGAALARAVRLGVLDEDGGQRARKRFEREWPDLVRLPITEALVARAETLAWDHALRGYDAVQLAAALAWQESIGQDVVLATFDRDLWIAAPRAGLKAWPETWPAPPRADETGPARDSGTAEEKKTTKKTSASRSGRARRKP